MHTSYFSKYKGKFGVAITAERPQWFIGQHYPDLAPTKDLLCRFKSGEISRSQYTKEYLQLLDDRSIRADKVLSDLGDTAVLLCYEKSGDFCHRHLAAEYLSKQGIIITEISDSISANQKRLFGK